MKNYFLSMITLVILGSCHSPSKPIVDWQLEILSPDNGEIVKGKSINVSFELELKDASNNNIQFETYLDSVLIFTGTNIEFTLDSLDYGNHFLEIKVVENQIHILTTASVNFQTVVLDQPLLFLPTNGYAVDIDIEGDVLAVAANYDGYYLFDVVRNEGNGNTSTLNELEHVLGVLMDTTAGDNRAEEIHVSLSHNSVFIVDRFDKIWIHKLSGLPYLDNYLPICISDVWLSLAYDDSQQDTLLLYPLVKHNSAIGGAEFDAYSASVVFSTFWEYPDFEEFFGTSCEFGVNISILADKISYSDSLLSVAMGELGVTLFKQQYDGSIDPLPFAHIDTPGEVYSLYSIGHTIFAGLSYYKGCYMALLDNQGNVENNLTFAEGTHVRGIDSDGELVALACGYDGVLIYEWQGDGQMKFLGSLETGYANAVAVQQNTVFAATRDGIEVYNIER